MTNLDMTKTSQRYYKAGPRPELVTIPAGRFLTIEGKGTPEAPVFGKAIAALFAIAYSIRAIHKQQGQVFTVPKLEGQWWLNVNKPFKDVSRDEWFWKLLVQMPAFVTAGDHRQAIALAVQKKEIPLLADVKFETMEDGLSVQMLHTGPYTEEEETLQKLRDYMEQHHLVQNGLHHEVYISDPRRTAPEKLRTILRLPVK
ncbi:GyrI-like domain-containing protein [uncultured Chitinophaga sp.]|uniref:GyrI-like domain-containing protein n=1 Tax=uncultured Chitinophaga sp. TaxID=339340 RepID=UPI0025EE6FB3|nr:GyrI-like domain-containing protein [uncultured Chitinophaga sp.]